MVNVQNGDAAERGLRHYLRLIVELLGADLDAAWYEWVPEITAYLPLDVCVTASSRTFALRWDERAGWAIGLDDDDFHVVARHSESIVPPPRVVAAFAQRVVAGEAIASDAVDPCVGSAGAEVRRQLAAYAPL